MRHREQGRVLAILIALLLIAGAGVVAWYFLIYTKSPQYALNQFFAAAKANDSEKASQWMDTSGMLLASLSTMANPSSLIYPGFGGSSQVGTTESVEIGTITVEGDTAKAQVTMVVKTLDGQKNTIKPTYVLRKVEGKWKVAVEPTFAGSFNEFVPLAVQQVIIRQLRQLLNQPGIGAIAKQQMQGMRTEIEKYPQLADFFKRAGLL